MGAVFATIVGAMCPVTHAQVGYFNGAERVITTSYLNQPSGIAVDASGNVYISDSDNARVLKETLSRGTYTESTIAYGVVQVAGVAVDSNGNVYFGDNGTGRILKETLSGGTYTQSVVPTSALGAIGGLAVDSNGDVYISDTGNSRVLKETLSGNTYIESIVGSGLLYPRGVAVDASGNVYIADQGNNRIVKETPSGGSYTQSVVVSSGLDNSWGVAVDGAGNVFIADATNRKILKETPSGGTYSQSTVPTGALNNALGIAADRDGNVYIAQTITGTAIILKEVAPTSDLDFGTANVGSHTLAVTLFFTFTAGGTIGAPAVLTQGSPNLDFADNGTGSCATNGTNHVYSAGDICTIDMMFAPRFPGTRYGAVVIENSSGNRIATQYIHGTGLGPQVNFLPGTRNTLPLSNVVSPYAIAEGGEGNLYIAEAVSANSPKNAVVKETWTGNGYTQSAVATGLVYPVGVAVDGAGNVYIADQNAGQIIKETPLKGGGYTPSATFSSLGTVRSVAVDGSGNVYIGSNALGLIKETLTAGSYYVQSTIDRTAYASGIAVDGAGNLYFTMGDSQLFKETLSNGSYTRSTIDAGLGQALGVSVDVSGNVFVADIGNSRLIKETLSGGGYSQSTLASNLNGIIGVAVDGSGNVFASSAQGNSVERVNFSSPPSLSFALATSGSTSSAQTVTVANIGNTPLNFPISASGNNPSISANFSLSSTGSTACPLVGANSSMPGTLAAGDYCQLPISFTPASGGSITGALVLTDTSLNAMAPGYAVQSIALSGSALDLPALSFATIASQTYGNAPFTVSATSASSGTVTYAVASGPATISGSTVTLTGAGTVVLSANQTASGNYGTAMANASFTVVPMVPALSFATIASQTYGNAPFTVSATSASSGTVTYAVVSGPATISGSIVTLTGTGAVVLSANQAASGNYAPATANTSFNVAAQTFTLASNSSSGSDSATTTRGGAASYILMLNPGAGTTFPNAVTFGVTGLPIGATATFSPATLPAGSGVTSVTLTIQTSNSQTARNEKSSSGEPLVPVVFGLLILPLARMKSARERLRQISRLSAMLAVVALSLGAVTSLSGCSSDDSSSPSAKSYAMVVTATDATTGTQSSTSLKLTVQ